MSKKKGLSFDDKKARMLAYMHEHKEVYSMKELESNVPKATGIVSQSIKDVVSHLMADGLLDSDKIGAGNFYWALPSKAKMMAVNRVEKTRKDLEAAQATHSELEAKLSEMESSRPTSTTRSTDLKKLALMKSQAAELEAEVAKFADSDPDRMKALERGTGICKAAANRWTDNITTLIGQIREMNPEVQEAQLLEQFGLPKNMDQLP